MDFNNYYDPKSTRGMEIKYTVKFIDSCKSRGSHNAGYNRIILYGLMHMLTTFTHFDNGTNDFHPKVQSDSQRDLSFCVGDKKLPWFGLRVC